MIDDDDGDFMILPERSARSLKALKGIFLGCVERSALGFLMRNKNK